MDTTSAGLLTTRRGRTLVFTALYVSEGAPIGFIWWALPTLLRAGGVDLAGITALTAVVALPWAFKFVWAPVVDALQGPRWSLRRWIVAAQLAMGATLLPLARLDLEGDLALVRVLLLLHAFAAATQDVAVDALAIATVPAAERGRVNGWMQAGMLTGRALTGGIVLGVAPALGAAGMVLVVVAVVWLSLLLVLAARDPAPAGGMAPRANEMPTVHAEVERMSRPDAARSSRAHHAAGRQSTEGHGAPHPEQPRDPDGGGRSREGRGAVAGRIALLAGELRHALGERATWAGLVFAGTAGAGFEAVGAVTGPFLVDRDISEAGIGAFFSGVSVPAMIVGALAGGRASDRLGKRASVAAAAAALAASIVVIAALDGLGIGGQAMLLGALGVFYVAIGLFTAASYALFMDLTRPALAATQFSAFMAMTNLCEAWSTLAVGRAAARLGYASAFLVMAAVAVLPLPLLRWLRPGEALRRQ